MEDKLSDEVFGTSPKMLDTDLFSIDTKEAQKMLDTMERISIYGNLGITAVVGIICYTAYKILTK